MTSAKALVRPFHTVRSDEILSQVDQDQFRHEATGWLEVMPAGRTDLAAVTAVCSASAALRPLPMAEIPIQRPIGMPDQGPGLLHSVAFPRLTISRLKDAICIRGGVILQDEYLLENSFTHVWEQSFHKHMEPVGQNRWTLHPDRIPTTADLPRIEGPVLYLDEQNIDWFGHVIADQLSPAWAYDYLRMLLGGQRIRILCSLPTFAFVETFLQLIGIPDQDRIFITQPVICSELLVASKAMHIQHYIAPPAFRLWQGIRNKIGAVSSVPERLYVSRRNNPTRPLIEEEAIENLFSAQGFYILHPEDVTLIDQIRLFAGARLIAGCSGSNMFNLAFHEKAEAVFIMVSPLLIHYSEQMFCSSGKAITLDVVVGYTTEEERAARPGNVHAPWHLDVAATADYILQWLKRAT